MNLELRENENHVNTEGVMIDTYFVAVRDGNERISKSLGDDCTACTVKHTDDVSTALITVAGTTLIHRLYKKKAGKNRLVAYALTCEVTQEPSCFLL